MMKRPSIVEFWSEMTKELGDDYHRDWPLVHPRDKDELLYNPQRQCYHDNVQGGFTEGNFPQFVSRAGPNDKIDKNLNKLLELGLLPHPYCGNLATADIIVVMLNPGLGLTDYYGELGNASLRNRLLQNLRQDFSDTRFPFMWLDPALCWHGGFTWWENKFSGVIKMLRQNGKSRFESLELISRRVANLELVPYHSKSTPKEPAFRTQSSKTMRHFIQSDLLQRATNGNALVVLARRANSFAQNTSHDNLLCFDRLQARRANFDNQTCTKIVDRLVAQNPPQTPQ